MAIRVGSSIPGAHDRPRMFSFDRPVRWGTENVINIRDDIAGTLPPPANNRFLLLDGTHFLLLDGTSLLLL